MWVNLKKTHLIGLLVIPLLVSTVANAYTIVLRDGRRVDIPNDFVISASTLTYQAGTGIQITMQLAIVDIGATEKANKETSGAFYNRLNKSKPELPTARTAVRGSVVTNDDLERFRSARVASEVAFDKRRKELGLPSVEESREAAALVSERTQETLRSIRSQQDDAESYWRGRAASLRSELAAVNEQINLVQARLNELPLNYAFGAFTTVAPFGSFGSAPMTLSVDQLARGARPPIINTIAPQTLTARGGFGNGRIRGRVLVNNFGRHQFARRPFVGGFPGSFVALPYDAYDNAYERSALLSQLDQLLIQRAGMLGRFRALEDEVRQAGAYPGWLR